MLILYITLFSVSSFFDEMALDLSEFWDKKESALFQQRHSLKSFINLPSKAGCTLRAYA